MLGENGAGKSTLIKVLGGIYIAEEGEIFIDGKKVTIDGVNASHNNGISIIHQELVLVPHMTVAENIFLGREPSKGLWVSHETMEKEAQQLLDTRPEKFAVVYTDFSDFKYINDVFGYDYGDLLLSQYGKLLLKGLHEYELCGRVSADNFVLLLHYNEKSEIAARQADADYEILRFMHTAHDGRCPPQTAVSAA